MDNFALIFTCLFAGLVVSRLKLAPADSYRSVNAWLLYFAMPALSLRFIPDIHFTSQLLILCVGPVIVWLGAFAFVSTYAKCVRLEHNTRTALFLSTALGNTAFIGFPLVSAYFGNEGLTIAIIFDQVTFLLFSTLAIIVVLRNTGNSHNTQQLIRSVGLKLLRFPPFIACVVAFTLPHFLDYSPAYGFLERLSSTLSPLALFSIGMQIRIGEWRAEWRNLVAGLSYKLIIAPLLVAIFALVFATGDYAKISIFQAAMPSHVTVSLLAIQYQLNPRLCALMVGFSIVLCFASTFMWYIISNLLF